MKILSAAAAICGVAFASACSPVDYCADTGVAKDGALFASQNFVKQRLKAPSSAQFPTSSTAPGVRVIQQGQCKFMVVAWTDAQNSFGVPLRMQYAAVVSPDENGRYSLDELLMDE